MPRSRCAHGNIITGINVTPLVDITLVLLIIFMVTAKIIVTPAVPLDLPQATNTEEVQVVLSIIVPAKGPSLVDGAIVADRASLEARAGEALKANADLRAVVQADGAVPHQRVLEVLDALKTAGITRIAFGAEALGASQP